MKAEVSVSALLALAISLLTLGVTRLEKGDTQIGLPCLIIGFGLVVLTVILFKYGIIQAVKRGKCASLIERSAHQELS